MAKPNPDAHKVLIIDDSTSARAMLRMMVETDPGLTVMATAGDAYIAARHMKTELPDVILLDLELPGLDGLSFLRMIMKQHPIPVVVCSGLTEKGSEKSLAALEAGAVEVILKPSGGSEQRRAEVTHDLCEALRDAAETKRRGPAPARMKPAGPKQSPDLILPPPNPARVLPPTEPVVFIGASTGGTEALRVLLTALPADAPAIAVVQHMPQGFTAAFAKRLNTLCAMSVAEAAEGMVLTQGRAIIAQGDKHLVVRRSGVGYRTSLVEGPAISRHRPSVDVLFRSAAISAGANAMGIMLTGMGDDGALCMAEMRRAGALTIAQDEASCVVYGMPREAVRLGGAVQTVALDRMAAVIMNFARRHRVGDLA
jgi:two-component system chemotaxis response regulator CheB